MMVGYFSYAWFTVQQVQKYTITTGTLTGKIAIGNDSTIMSNGSGAIEYTPTSESATVTLTVTNINSIAVKNSLYYYDLTYTDLSIGYTGSTGSSSSNTVSIPSVTGIRVEPGETLTYSITISGGKGKTVKIGSSMGLVNSDLSLPSGTNAFEKSGTQVARKIRTSLASSSIDDSDSKQTFIKGATPSNYIWYSGKLWRAVSIDPSDSSVKLVTQWNISSIPYNSSGKYSYVGSHMKEWLNDTSVDGFLYNLREASKFTKSSAVWNYGITGDETTTETVTAAVGLLTENEYSSTGAADGYLNNGLSWWLMSRETSLFDDTVVYVTHVSDSGDIEAAADPEKSYGIRPAINLKKSVEIISGTGTETDPYRLRGDNDSPTSGTLLSTRYSGEYISFGTGENNLYRIVSHENGTGTKITSASPLKSNGSYITQICAPTQQRCFVVPSFLTGDYLTNGTYLTNEQVNMIEDNTEWYFGSLSTSGGDSYKLAKYENTTGNTTIQSNSYKVNLLRVGEMMSGQFDKKANNIDYWSNTITSSNPISYYIVSDGNVNYSNNNVLHGIKPAMNLKSNVVITGGDGTKNNPFTVKLAS